MGLSSGRTPDRGASTQVFSATYDGDGRRVTKDDGPLSGSGPRTYSHGLYDTDGTTANVHTPGLAQRSGSTDRFFHQDWLGSTRYLTAGNGDTTSGLRYDAYGNRSATAGSDGDHPTDYLFAGRWGYETEYADGQEPGLGLQYLHHRYYDPAVGRFLTPDPIGLAGGPNLYNYAGNNPVGFVDPLGLFQDRLDRHPAADDLLAGINTLAHAGESLMEFLASFNPITTTGIAINKLGGGDWKGAFWALPVLAAFSKARNIGGAVNRFKGVVGAGRRITLRNVSAPEGKVFAQPRYSSRFSSDGAFSNVEVRDMVSALQSGSMSPSDLPISTITREGRTFIINTRSYAALEQAGLANQATFNSVTGNEFFERWLTNRLADNVRRHGGTRWWTEVIPR